MEQMLNKRFGRWLVIGKSSKRANRIIFWLCKCKCGTIRTVSGNSLRLNRSKSCGCFQIERASEIRHGHARHSQNRPSVTYISWQKMRSRCLNPNNRNYFRYGGRGITICKRWNKFENFLSDIGERPPKHSLDRINGDKGYYPYNCRWVTQREQVLNRKATKYLTYKGKTLCLSEWADKFNIPRRTFIERFHRGWHGKMLFAPPWSYYVAKNR